MNFVIGFLIWLALGLVAGILSWSTYRAAGNTARMSLTFGVFGAFIGGMLGTAGYVYHDPTPLRFGGLLGAALGGLLFSFLYHFIGRKAV